MLSLTFYQFAPVNKKKFLHQSMHLRNLIEAYTISFPFSYEKLEIFWMEKIKKIIQAFLLCMHLKLHL